MEMRANSSAKVRTDLSVVGKVGAAASVFFLGGILLWAQLAQFHGAVIAQGTVVVPGKPKSIQHLDGGIVADILVQDGDRVEPDTILVKFDDTLLNANLGIYRNRLLNSLALRDRLIAEQSDSDAIHFADIPALASKANFATARAAQEEIFVSRRDVQKKQQEQLAEKIVQFNNQISGVQALVLAKKDQFASIQDELERKEKLVVQGNLPLAEIAAVKRSHSDLLGQLGEHASEVSRISNSIRDTELEMALSQLKVDEENATRLSEVQIEIEELIQQIQSTEKQLERVIVRAPIAGLVHELQVTTIGGVLQAGATIAQVVPVDSGILFEMRVEPAAIDQVYINQEVVLRLSAFNHRVTPDIFGFVVNVSADSILDPISGVPFYRLLIAANAEELAKLKNANVLPGMPVEAFLQTEPRTVISFFLQPVVEQIARAFKEQ